MGKNSMGSFIIGFFLLLPNAFAKSESESGLTIFEKNSTQHVLTDQDFRILHLDSIEVQDPVYNSRKRYAGYWLSDIFKAAGVKPDPDTIWVFTAMDGYKARVAVADVMRSGVKAFVAVRDLDAPETWIKIKQGKEMISPGPYYLVWQTPTDAPADIKLPWPYQMVVITIRAADEAQQKLFPDRAQKSESVVRGFKVFKQNCLACHSVNLEGGVLGPELNVPKNILEYRERKFLKSFIEDPNAYRARSKMPSFKKTLTSKSIDDVLDYLNWMGKHKIP